MAVPEAIKEYIARNYGDGECITTDTGDNLGTACMTENLTTPLPEGYTQDDVCTEEVISWAYDNVGWCITATPTPTPITPTPVPAYNITIDSTPTGASIKIDGKKTYRMTPETFDLEGGSHNIVLTKDGYEEEEHTITVTSDEKYSWTLAALPPPTPTPIEIEVVRRKLRGAISIGHSRIPRRIATTAAIQFRIHVDNPAIGVLAKYKVTLTFVGINTYAFSSGWSDLTKSGDYVNVYVTVTLPEEAIPAGTEVAYYDLICTLEAEET